ncbi:unnamed protein product [Didymodactylos carnosus]|uniref:Cytochrome P450 n=1 Tax=Didymodactylos carnosus TaxID=1234261 RepID=A0A8S2FNZ6_9BILA|nr:unnamed protein product [Didymodactylos carnosus]CAF4298161.1 unnamed protein product [Didymodactylos carnosus]
MHKVSREILCLYESSVIQPDVFSIHYDNELWGPHDSQDFYPERHLDKQRHPLAYMAFGSGPRNCVGIRFALVEIKCVLIRLLKQYTIMKCDKLETNLSIGENIVVAPKEVWIKLEKRL